VLHTIELEVAEEDLASLLPSVETRVPARFTFDGLTQENIGVRLKGDNGSLEPLEGKPGFSVKFDEFTDDQEFNGLKKLILNSEVQDRSFVSRRVGYELWRRAGLETRRTSYAVVFLNGERYGIYTVEEAVNKQYLKSYFTDPSGNLYEGSGTDITNVERLQLKTNEEENDRTNLAALREVLDLAPDAELMTALAARVDLDAFFAYWAVEALLYHYDGYGVTMIGDTCCSPNNYYVYDEPGRGFVFIPHGIDQLLRDVAYDVRQPPSERARLAARLFALPEGKARLAQAITAILDTAWDTEALVAYLTASSEQVQAAIADGPHESATLSQVQFLQARYIEFLRGRPDIVRQQLAQGF
jgi:spore coat protein CotH